MRKTQPMPSLCVKCGPLPDKLRPFLDNNGDLRAGDAVGLEAQWVLSSVVISGYLPEDDYSESECTRSRVGSGCVLCGDPDAPTQDGECSRCQGAIEDLAFILDS